MEYGQYQIWYPSNMWNCPSIVVLNVTCKHMWHEDIDK